MAEKGVKPGSSGPDLPLEELDRAAAELDYDAVIKPARSYEFWEDYNRRKFIFRSPAAYQRVRHVMRTCRREVVVQEFIPGDEIYMVYVSMDRNGRPLAVCGYDKIRQYTGTGCFCVSKKRADLIETSVNTLRSIGFHGIAEPEFKRGPRDGRYKLLEVNSRSSTQNRYASCVLAAHFLGRKPGDRDSC